MIKIGLTGGIGSGKSTVSEFFREKGITVIDCDEISRNLTKKGGEALEPIRTRLGEKYFTPEGELDRRLLAADVFSDPVKKAILEEITTGVVIEKSLGIIEELEKEGRESAVIIDAPLLFECGLQGICTETWLVTASEEIRIRRVIARDGISEEEILGRMRNQMPEYEKRALADVIIDNSGTLEDLNRQLTVLIERIKLCD